MLDFPGPILDARWHPRPWPYAHASTVSGRVHVRALVRYLRTEHRKVRGRMRRNAGNCGLARKARHVRVRGSALPRTVLMSGPSRPHRPGPQESASRSAIGERCFARSRSLSGAARHRRSLR